MYDINYIFIVLMLGFIASDIISIMYLKKMIEELENLQVGDKNER